MTAAGDTSALLLRRLGWTVTDTASLTRAVSDFQRGYALPGRPALLVDGKAGPKTRSALVECDKLRAAGKPTASRHFSFQEFRCKCGGKYAGCAVLRVHRELLIGLDAYRELVHRPVTVVSGYRCQTHNARVGGKSMSQHLYGGACDVEYRLDVPSVARLRRFSGIGKRKSSGLVRHVDVRHVSGNNPTGGTPDRPTQWVYAS